MLHIVSTHSFLKCQLKQINTYLLGTFQSNSSETLTQASVSQCEKEEPWLCPIDNGHVWKEVEHTGILKCRAFVLIQLTLYSFSFLRQKK